jgi:hypothetical protein
MDFTLKSIRYRTQPPGSAIQPEVQVEYSCGLTGGPTPTSASIAAAHQSAREAKCNGSWAVESVLTGRKP